MFWLNSITDPVLWSNESARVSCLCIPLISWYWRTETVLTSLVSVCLWAHNMTSPFLYFLLNLCRITSVARWNSVSGAASVFSMNHSSVSSCPCASDTGRYLYHCFKEELVGCPQQQDAADQIEADRVRSEEMHQTHFRESSSLWFGRT